jgi:hypothetical protein
MRCDQFQQRLDWLLDQRQDVGQDKDLCRHSEECDVCRDRLEIWNQIDDLVSTDPAASSRADESPHLSRRSNNPVKMRLMLSTFAAAAAALFFVSHNPMRQDRLNPVASVDSQDDAPTVAIPREREDSSVIEKDPPVQDSLVTIEHAGQPVWRSSRWWTAMSDDQWVSQTIPAVTSVRLGVAPIGRSMKRALSILMLQTNSTPLSPSSATPEGGRDPFQEQSSSGQWLTRIAGLS